MSENYTPDIDQAKLFQTISLAVEDATRQVLENKHNDRIEELEILNRRLTARWEGAQLRYAEDSKRIEELEAENAELKRLLNASPEAMTIRFMAADLKAKEQQTKLDAFEKLHQLIKELADDAYPEDAHINSPWLLEEFGVAWGKERE